MDRSSTPTYDVVDDKCNNSAIATEGNNSADENLTSTPTGTYTGQYSLSAPHIRNSHSNPELSTSESNNNDINVVIDGSPLSNIESDHDDIIKKRFADLTGMDGLSNGMDNPTFSLSMDDLTDNEIIATPMDSTHNVNDLLRIDVGQIDGSHSTSGFSGSINDGGSPAITPTGNEQNTHDANNTETVCNSLSVRRSWNNPDFISLIYSHHKKVELKDFTREIRAQLDVENFINRSVLLLDLHENSLDKIIDKMLTEMNRRDSDCDVKEAKNALYTANSNNVLRLAQTIQGTCPFEGETVDFDQQWICTMTSVPSAQRKHVGIARLHHPANLGHTSQEVHFVILVLAPTKEKGTKNAVETGRTFATMLTGLDFRQKLMSVHTEDEFMNALREEQKKLTQIQKLRRNQSSGELENPFLNNMQDEKMKCWFGRGLRMDLKRRLPHFISDFTDGVTGQKTIQKVISTIFFLYFAIILPGIAFGVLNYHNTGGSIGVTKVLMSQAFGGIIFSLIGGQPLIILLTTAPLAIYTKVIKSISDELNTDFYAMYACVGIWNSFFLILYSLTNASSLMKYCTRSTEEIFALFISVAFSVDAIKSIYYNFHTHYLSAACELASDAINSTNDDITTPASVDECHRDTSLLYLILMFGTLWVGTYLYNFTKSPFLDARKREILADYSLPVAVLLLSFCGSYLLAEVPADMFIYQPVRMLEFVQLKGMSFFAVLISMGLGFCLSILFYMDQNISSSMVNNPTNKLKKGPAYHWDLFVIALINGFLSIFGMPWVHAALPHSPLHVRALADVEEHVIQGHVYDVIVHVRETRLTTLVSHIMICLSLLMLPVPLQYIPIPVLYGLFLYVAVTALNGNEMFERIILLLTEQSAYPPTHYIRRVPQRKVHMFTGLQLLQLAALCALGFSPLPYLKMVFPVILMLFIPIRMKLTPLLFDRKYLRALDGH